MSFQPIHNLHLNCIKNSGFKKIEKASIRLWVQNSTRKCSGLDAILVKELTDNSSYKEEDYSKDYEWPLPAPSDNKHEIIILRISNLLYSNHFLIPFGQKSSNTNFLLPQSEG